jgi:mannitol/fructose-specific phosphotransferase system IIA component (Ntr-type)
MVWVSAETTAVNVSAKTWQEAVRTVGQLLVKAGAAEPRYIEAMIRTVQELGAYIVLAPGMALPHARPEDGARKVGFAAITLSEGVNFGNPDNDPVRLVIAFCAPDPTSHLYMLERLARKLEQPGFIQKAIAAPSPQELAALFEEEDVSTYRG